MVEVRAGPQRLPCDAQDVPAGAEQLLAFLAERGITSAAHVDKGWKSGSASSSFVQAWLAKRRR